MKILIVGTKGKLAKELTAALSPDHEVDNASYDFLDFTERFKVCKDIAHGTARLVINATAYNSMEACEHDPFKAYTVNALAVGEMADACNEQGIPFIHFSTDYVFWNGVHKGGSFDEIDRPDSQWDYGRSKLLGEQLARSLHTGSMVFRLSTLYDHERTGPLDPIGQFVRAEKLKILSQVCCPTSVHAVAKAVRHVVDMPDGLSHTGIFHLTTTRPVSRADFVSVILNRLHGEQKERSFEIYEPKIPRPRTTVLNCDRFQETFNYRLPTWEEDLEDYLFKRG